jgi:DNA-binding transcriptional regulator YdaS (Cro superfamily)
MVSFGICQDISEKYLQNIVESSHCNPDANLQYSATMKKIAVSVLLALWDDIKAREWESDNNMAIRVGISPSTVTHWRTGRVKAVQPRTIKQIEEAMGYDVSLSDAGEWRVVKKGIALDLARVGESTGTYHAPPKQSQESPGATIDPVSVARLYAKFSRLNPDDQADVEKFMDKLLRGS